MGRANRPLMFLLFCLSLHKALVAANARLQEGESLFACLVDVHATCSPDPNWAKTKFGQTKFGQSQIGPNQVGPKPSLAKPSLVNPNIHPKRGMKKRKLWREREKKRNFEPPTIQAPPFRGPSPSASPGPPPTRTMAHFSQFHVAKFHFGEFYFANSTLVIE